MRRSPRLEKDQRQALARLINDHGRSARECKRAQAIMMVDRQMAIPEITEMTGLGRSQIFNLRKQYANAGITAITDKKKKNPKELLTAGQRKLIIETIKTKTPNGCDPYYNSDYWSTGILGEYIKRTYNVRYKSKTSVYLVFRQARFSYHKPGKVSDRRSNEEVAEWRIDAGKRIAKAWDDPNVVILAEDEMHLSTQTTVQKIWLPKGEYPKIEVYQKRKSRSVYGFLNVKTGAERAFKTDWQNMYITAAIIPEIRKLYPNKKILLIWDQAGWHRGIEAQRAIERDGNIDQIYFPTAAPEENPQEHVWKSGRSQVTHNTFIQDINAATDAFVTYLNTTRFPYALLGLKSDAGV